MTPWPEVSLGETCELKYGKSLAANRRDGGEFPVYGSNGIVGHHSKSLTNGATIVVGRKGSFGEVTFSETPCWPIDTTYYIDSDATAADLKWLTYRLKALGLTTLNRAAAVPGLNREDAYRQRFILPPIEEQRRIAAILDQADELRAKRRQVLAHLDDLTQSIFHDMFGSPSTWPERWPMGTIGDMADSTQYGTSAKAGESGFWPVIRMGNITDSGRLDLSDLKYMDMSTEDEAKYTVRKGDLLFNRTNSAEKVGKSCVVDTDGALAFAGYLVRVRINARHRPEFVAAYLSSDHGRRVRRRMAKAAVNQANINANEMKTIRIALPPEDLQQLFVERTAAARSHVALMDTDEYDGLFASLQMRAFRGDL